MFLTAIFFFLFAISSSFADPVNITVTLTDPSVHHTGNWTGGSETQLLGSSLSYSFNGTAFYLIMSRFFSYGEGVFVFDGKSYSWDGYVSPDSNDGLDEVCALCLTDLDADTEHNVKVTFTANGQAGDDAVFVIDEMLYTANETATAPNTFTYPGTSTSNSPSSGNEPGGSPSSETPASSSGSTSSSLPIIIGVAVGGVALLLSCGAAFYFYRRGRRLAAEATRPPWERADFAPMPDTGDRGYMGYRERAPPPASYLPPASSSQSSSSHGEQDRHTGTNPQSSGAWVAAQQQHAPPSEKQRLMIAANLPYDNSPSPSTAHGSSSTQHLLPSPAASNSAPMSEKQRLALATDSPYNDNSQPAAMYSSNISPYRALNPSENSPRALTSAPVPEKQRRTRIPESSPRSQGGATDVPDQLRAQVERLAGLLEARDTPPGYN